MAEELNDTHDEGIYPEAPGHAVPEPMPLSEFAPWHLPRKQWVRNLQWRDCTRRLAKELQLDDRPLRYLGLPGTELLDLEVLANLCVQLRIRFRYLGFNTGAQSPKHLTMQRLSEDLIKTIEGVEMISTVVTDDILSLASKSGMAYYNLQQIESFDVINLDLCDVFTTQPGREVHTAVRNIVEYQVNSRMQPWLLFITTAVDRNAVSEADLAQYRAKFNDNSAKWQDFQQAATSLLEAEMAENPFDTVSGVKFGKLLAVSIGKWLASLLRGSAPWKVELKSCVCYRRGLPGIRVDQRPIPEPEMFSLVYGVSCPHQALIDPAGLAKAAEAPVIDWNQVERKMAVQMAKKATIAIDLDRVLQLQSDTYRRLTEESAELLRLRNYDAELYRKYAREIPRLPEG